MRRSSYRNGAFEGRRGRNNNVNNNSNNDNNNNKSENTPASPSVFSKNNPTAHYADLEPKKLYFNAPEQENDETVSNSSTNSSSEGSEIKSGDFTGLMDSVNNTNSTNQKALTNVEVLEYIVKIQELENEISNTKTQITSLESEKENLEKTLTDEVAKLQSEKAELEKISISEMSKLHLEKEDLEKRLENLKNSPKDTSRLHQHDIDYIKSQHSAEVSKLNQQIDDRDKKISAQADEISSLKNKIQEVTQELHKTTRDYDVIIAVLNQTNQGLSAEITRLNNELSALRNQLAGKNTAITNLTQQNTQKDTRITQLNAQVANLTAAQANSDKANTDSINNLTAANTLLRDTLKPKFAAEIRSEKFRTFGNYLWTAGSIALGMFASSIPQINALDKGLRIAASIGISLFSETVRHYMIGSKEAKNTFKPRTAFGARHVASFSNAVLNDFRSHAD